MYNYIKSVDPFKHLITTSYAGCITSSNQSVFSVLDFTQSHDYKDPIANTNDDFQNHFYAIAQNSIYTMNKPYQNVSGNVVCNKINRQVFYKTFENKINSIWWNLSTGIWNWSGLNNSANNVAGDLMADNAGKVFYRSTNSNINCIYWTNGSCFWSGLDNSTSNNVYSGNIATDNLGNVFFRGSNNRIHYKSQCYYILSTNFQKNALLDSDYSENTNKDKYAEDSELGILIYPNPTNNKISIASNEYIEQLYVYNIDGKLIKGSTNLNVNKVEIDVSMYNGGFYFIKAYLANGQFINRKFIVKH